MNLPTNIAVNTNQPDCARCDRKAVAVWGTSWSHDEAVCEDHDPTRQPWWAMPTDFHYQSLDYSLAAPHTIGHLTMHLP